MFKNKFEMGRLMNEAGDAGGGAGGSQGGQASGGQQTPPVVESVEDIKKQLEAVKAAKDEILNEKKKLKEELDGIRKMSSEEEKKKLMEERNFEKLLTIEMESKKQLQDRLDLLERTQTEERTKLVKTEMVSVFKKELGAELVDEDLALSQVSWEKFVKDDKSKIGWNEDGIKQAVAEFRNSKSYFIKTGDVKIPQHAAKAGSEKKSFADRAGDAGLLIGKK